MNSSGPFCCEAVHGFPPPSGQGISTVEVEQTAAAPCVGSRQCGTRYITAHGAGHLHQRPGGVRFRQSDQAIRRSRRPFSAILRVGAGDPVFGALPPNTQAQQGLTDGLATDHARRHALGEADLGGELEGPQAAGVAKLARAAVQERAELLGTLAWERLWRGPVGTGRAFLERGETQGVERMHRIQHGLVVAA
jgi:hypothetical protein